MANGLTNAKILLDKVKSGKEPFHVIEVMACPGGCCGGGGQPYPPEGVKVLDTDWLFRRGRALYQIDRAKRCANRMRTRRSRRFTTSFLGGPGTEKAHELLHTHYQAREPRGIR